MNLKKDELNFKIRFKCKCENNDMNRFIIKRYDKHLNLLCTQCERRYKVKVVSQEIK